MTATQIARLAAPKMSGDRPIEGDVEDRLGFQPLATRLASSLVEQDSTDGLVLGIEGRWGSGKSSLLNMTVKALRALHEEVRPVVVEFKPWLIGDRDALLASFFAELAKQVEAIERESGKSRLGEKRVERQIVEGIRKYSETAETIGSAIAFIPGAGGVSQLVKLAGTAGKKAGKKPTLLSLKKELDTALSDLKRRIVVCIDDVDRLEPREVIELLRLVRSVADFKNVIYVLCFDAEILAKSIQAGIQVKDGRAYLEKIVQIEVSVPLPEPFQLRRWFQQDFNKFVGDVSEAEKPRLFNVVDVEGGRRLSTPRQVVRALNSLHLLIPALRGTVDVPDLVWLQLIRCSNHQLYRWIEDYSATAAASSSTRVSISDTEKRKSFADLKKALGKDGLTFDSVRYDLASHLPGIETLMQRSEEGNVPILNKVNRWKIDDAIAGRRLASPDHYRLYFALTQPTAAPRIEDFDLLLDASATSFEHSVELLRQWMGEVDPTIGSKAETMLNRLRDSSAEALTPSQASNLLLALADVADEAPRDATSDVFGDPSFWREAERMLPVLLGRLQDQEKVEMIEGLFRDGKSLGWLTSLLRHETFSHGRFGTQLKSETSWLLKDDELDLATSVMVKRYKTMTMDDFARLPSPLSALFAWLQAGDQQEPRNLVATWIESDQGVLNTLSMFVTEAQSSDGNYRKLKRENLSPFLDYDEVKARINRLASQGSGNLRKQAEQFTKFFNNAEND